jgi:hypothetical protein
MDGPAELGFARSAHRHRPHSGDTVETLVEAGDLGPVVNT